MPQITTLHFSTLQTVSGLCQAVTTRGGGQSDAPFQSLNLGYHVGDDPTCVSRNRRILAEQLGYDAPSLVAAQQVHGAHAQFVNFSTRGRGALNWDCALPATDALITREQQLPLLILVADCAPLLFVDSSNQVLAVVHAGWRGAVARIASQTVLKMQGEFGSQPAQMQVGIGPCLCAACFEIGDEVSRAAREVDTSVICTAGKKSHLDLRALLCRDLESAGVLNNRIEIMPHCPRCDTQTFFSHRAERGKTGRFGLVAWWE